MKHNLTRSNRMLFPLVLFCLLLCNIPAMAATNVSGTISTDTTWSLANSPYVVTGNITVQGTDGDDNITTLAIEPGVIVKFNTNTRMTIGAYSGSPGALSAVGTGIDKIMFTSSKETPAPGDWTYIHFDNTTDDSTTILDHCVVEYSGGSQGAVYLSSASPTIRNTTITNSKYAGVYGSGSSPVLLNNNIRDNATYGLNLDSSGGTVSDCDFNNNGNYDLYSSGTFTGDITNNVFRKNIYIGSGTVSTLTGNTFHYANIHPARIGADSVGDLVTANTLTGTDAQSMVDVTTGTIEKDAAWTPVIQYKIIGNLTVQGTHGPDSLTTLTLDPGATLKFNPNTRLTIGGYSGDPGALSAVGTDIDNIVFTSSKETPTPGDWTYIQFDNTTDDSTTILDHCVVEYGGGSQGALYLSSASPTIRNTTIKNSKYAGVYGSGSSPILLNNNISDNATYGLNLNSSGGTVSDCDFNNNGNYDLYSSGTFTGDITNNVFRKNIYIGSGKVSTLTGNTFHYANTHPVRIGADSIGDLVTANTLTGTDAQSMVDVTTGTIEKDAAWTPAVQYKIIGNLTVQGTHGPDNLTTLTLDPGVTLKFNRNTRMTIGGYSGDPGALSAVGTDTDKIMFTSAQAVPAPGDWTYIQFNTTTDDSTTILDHCIVEYGGGSQGAVYLISASPTIRNTTVKNSKYAGVYGSGSSPVLLNNNIRDNATYGLNLNSSGGIVSDCDFNNNGNYDLYSSGTFTGDITNNVFRKNIYIGSGTVTTLTGNTFHYANTHPVRIGADSIGDLVTANTLTGTDAQSMVDVTTGTIEKDATWTSVIPYRIIGNLTVQGTDGPDSLTTLTLTPGVTLKFNRNTRMTIGGYSGDPGALSAVGTGVDKIMFTSAQAVPAPGDWYYIQFNNTTEDAATILDHCVVKYSGASQGALYLNNASPTIQNSMILASKYAGLYGSGAGSSAGRITCNTFSTGKYGIHWASDPPPDLHHNNFFGNTTHAVYYTGSTLLNAENNWWGDAQGPGAGNADSISGTIDADPWLSEEKQCSQDTVNLPPETPADPSPAPASVRVPVTGLTLAWTCSDPNPLDTLVYDITYGLTRESLQILATGVDANTFQPSGFQPGKTYYWQVTARDNKGLETPGPVWHFTTQGDNPDLIVSGLKLDPKGNFQAGDTLTLTAVIHNSGTGPAVDAFEVNFSVDDNSIDTAPVNTIVPAGESAQVHTAWTWTGTDAALKITADSANQVPETNENNNHLISLVSELSDDQAPVLTGHTPLANDQLQSIQSVWFSLSDQKGTVDDTAVIQGFGLENNQAQAIAGTTSENNDTFEFIPLTLPLADGAYTAKILSADTLGNMDHYSFGFIVDTTPPGKPGITGQILPRPAANTVQTVIVQITGTRDDSTGVWFGNSLAVPMGSGDWAADARLAPGMNSLEVRLKDPAGNLGEPVWIDIEVANVRHESYQYDASGRLLKIIIAD